MNFKHILLSVLVVASIFMMGCAQAPSTDQPSDTTANLDNQNTPPVQDELHDTSINIEGQVMKQMTVKEIADAWNIDSEALLLSIKNEFELEQEYTVDNVLDDFRAEYPFSPARVKQLADDIKGIEFDETYNVFNNDYKAALFATGQEKENVPKLMTNMRTSWDVFAKKYSENPKVPYAFVKTWPESMSKVETFITNAEDLVAQNKVLEAHKELEAIRAEFQLLKTQSEVRDFGFVLVEFHDVMEMAYESKDTAYCEQLSSLWDEVLELNNIERVDYQNKYNAEKTNIENFCEDSETGADALKKGYVAFYLAYG